MKRANQYNLKHNEFKPAVPPRDPKPYPQSITQEKQTTTKKKPIMGKVDKAKISSFVTEYLQEDSTKEVSPRPMLSSTPTSPKGNQSHGTCVTTGFERRINKKSLTFTGTAATPTTPTTTLSITRSFITEQPAIDMSIINAHS